jgi:hypothetical protein
MTRWDRENRMGGTALQKIELEYEKSLCHAFSSGMSVVEIAKRIGSAKAMPIYRTLQRRGLIGTGLKRSKYIGPAYLQSALKRVRLSFIQWCNAWGFDPKTAEEELSTPDSQSSTVIQKAARRDFPFVFKKGAASIDLDEWEREIAALDDRPSYSIDWEKRHQRYVGSIKGFDSLTITSRYPSVILMELVRVSWLLMAIELLGDRQLDKTMQGGGVTN